MKIAFDIGGVISRYPAEMKTIMTALIDGGVDVYVMTDMSFSVARASLDANGFDGDMIPDGNLLCADWLKHGDRCKTEVMEVHGIEVLIDDRPDYCAEGDFIGMVLFPRPQKPYYAVGWNNPGSTHTFVPTSEYEAFVAWKTTIQ